MIVGVRAKMLSVFKEKCFRSWMGVLIFIVVSIGVYYFLRYFPYEFGLGYRYKVATIYSGFSIFAFLFVYLLSYFNLWGDDQSKFKTLRRVSNFFVIGLIFVGVYNIWFGIYISQTVDRPSIPSAISFFPYPYGHGLDDVDAKVCSELVYTSSLCSSVGFYSDYDRDVFDDGRPGVTALMTCTVGKNTTHNRLTQLTELAAQNADIVRNDCTYLVKCSQTNQNELVGLTIIGLYELTEFHQRAFAQSNDGCPVVPSNGLEWRVDK